MDDCDLKPEIGFFLTCLEVMLSRMVLIGPIDHVNCRGII